MQTGLLHEDLPYVSVVMIFLDAEKFIEQAIESVLSQTYERWELLLIDDGSADASTAIARRYADAHPRKIRYLQHEDHGNRGTGASRNLGIGAAHGRYVSFLDADDIYLPQRLERHMTVFTRDHSIGLVISSSLYWHSWTAPDQLALKMRDEVMGVCATPALPLDPPELLMTCLIVPNAPMPCTCDITFSRELALANGGIPAQFPDQYEDQVLICQLLLKSRVVVLNECLAQYRQHAGSLTGRAYLAGKYRPGRAHEARFKYVLWLRDHLRTQGIQSVALDAKLQRELWPLEHPGLNRIREAALDTVRMTRQALRNVAFRVLSRSLLEKIVGYSLERKRARIHRQAASARTHNRKQTES